MKTLHWNRLGYLMYRLKVLLTDKFESVTSQLSFSVNVTFLNTINTSSLGYQQRPPLKINLPKTCIVSLVDDRSEQIPDH